MVMERRECVCLRRATIERDFVWIGFSDGEGVGVETVAYTVFGGGGCWMREELLLL
jgi:hypothetical protein